MAGSVLVTGGTGYIGGELIEQLLARGWRVHTTVRSKTKSEARLRERFADAGDRLAVFEADLTSDAGWTEANAGCSHVAHVASPFPVGVPRDADELIVPAREGTLRALRFAKAAGVARFVQTSSAAAIAYGHPPGKNRFDERDWTVVDAPGVQPYVQSKTIAERAARDWVAAEGGDLVFCSINPVGVFGPVASDDLSASVEFLRRLLAGQIPALPDIGIGVVDVRDVAALHVLALEADPAKVAGERFAAATEFLWMADMARILRERLGDAARKVPTRRMPTWMLKLLALASRDIRTMAGEAGRLRDVSGRHAVETLGWTPRRADDTIVETAHSLIALGLA